MWKKRAAGMCVIFISCIFILLLRLVQLQLWQPENFSSRHINLIEESVRQRSQEVSINDGRGAILDRHGTPLTYERKAVLILFPFLQKMDWPYEKIAAILGYDGEELLEAVKGAKEPVTIGGRQPKELTLGQIQAINALEIPGVFAAERNIPFEKVPASQLIGLSGENAELAKERYPNKPIPSRTVIGLSGLQKSFDEFLIGEGGTKLVFQVDGGGGPLFGSNARYTEPENSLYPASLKLTIDLGIQRKAEELADRHGIKKGGLVLLDIGTNSILAIVSRPEPDNKNPFSGGGFSNLMLKEQIIGSVFKTVIAAAAIDKGLAKPPRLFDCSRKINGEPDPVYHYGMLDFEESFARSCNNTFAQLAKELQKADSGTIEEYASKLSLTDGVGWEGNVFHQARFRQLPGEEKGRIFLDGQERKDANYAALTGIGQKEVRATPLAVANMMATIARDGLKEQVRAVSEIEYQDGLPMYAFQQNALGGPQLEVSTAKELQKMLRRVVTDPNGTGRWFSGLPYEAAGKSGTAETGRFSESGQYHNKWFAGYFPFGKPRYALVTVNLDVMGDEGGVNPLFADMVNFLYTYDQQAE
ncbi:peptidoglycan D,D-transpeptidase FtsI family protein [Bacillus sp. B-jedd]|uniref:peptidoglycan D,D-transpeptidase FtsI family protein n=1 Tax=Bacillus sp. B-jedd TaxID=1476857 RepID=UPI0005155FB9|nr:penicillin-binding transpeptidase domain-containing protein [Bacillus sp. B-jedd]CEG27965.1 penicillin-binding protein PBP4B [Bacillus sp. B-jedd]